MKNNEYLNVAPLKDSWFSNESAISELCTALTNDNSFCDIYKPNLGIH